MRIPPSTDDPLKSITIHQEIDFTASPQRIYEALLDTKQFTAFSGQKKGKGGGGFSFRRPHCRPERGTRPESKNRSGLAHRGLARRSVFDREVRTYGARIWDTFGLRPHRFSGGLTRSSGRRLAGRWIVNEIFLPPSNRISRSFSKISAMALTNTENPEPLFCICVSSVLICG